MDRSLAELESIVRSSVCAVCSDRTASGACSLEKPSGCALFSLFPRVANAVLSVKSGDVNDHVAAIRRGVCRYCGGEAPDGSCEARQQVRCALDAYLLVVVDAIEEATGKLSGRSSPGHAGATRARN